MTEVATKSDCFTAAFDKLIAGPAGSDWFAGTRKSAIDAFKRLGFPTRRHEEWQFTNVSAIASGDFARPNPAEVKLSETDIERVTFDGESCGRIVFVDGAFQPGLSKLDALPKGVAVTNLASAFREHEALLKAHLAQHAKFDEHTFIALNTALVTDGAVIHVDKSVVEEKPVEVIFVSTAGGGTMTHPRILCVAEANSQVSLVETHLALGDGVHFNNPVTEIVAQDNAVVKHHKWVLENDESFHISALNIHQYRACNTFSHLLSLEGGLIRNDVVATLDGEGGNCEMHGAYMTDGTQHVDNHLEVDHAEPHCDSREYFKGVLDGESKGIFSGKIIVREDAQKTDAKQTNMSLPLSKGAQIESKPQLEIFADDVKCTHGATIGQVSEEALFYIRSRGLAKDAAMSLLVYAFIAESFDEIEFDALRHRVKAWLLDKLPQGRLLKEL